MNPLIDSVIFAEGQFERDEEQAEDWNLEDQKQEDDQEEQGGQAT